MKKSLLSILLMVCVVMFSFYHAEVRAAKEESIDRSKKSGQIDVLINQSIDAAQMGKRQEADSLALLALSEAEMMYDKAMILKAFNHYFEHHILDIDRQSWIERINRVEGLAVKMGNSDLSWRTWLNLSEWHRQSFNFDQALEYSYKALSMAESLEGKWRKVDSYLSVGNSLEGKNSKVEAFRNYLNAYFLARSLRDVPLIRKCYARLAHFYNLNKVYDKAIDYKLLEADLIRSQLPLDSTALMWTYYELEAIALNSNEKVNERSLRRIIHFADRHKDESLLSSSLALLRSSFIDNNNIGKLYSFYLHEHPAYFNLLAVENPMGFLRVKALFSEYDQRYDSADYYLQRVEALMKSHHNLVLQAHFYLRYSEYLERRGEIPNAIEKAEQAASVAGDASFLDYVLKANMSLERLYVRQGNYQEALAYAIGVRQVGDSMRSLAKSEDLLRIEIDNAERLREMEEQSRIEETRRRNNIQYSAITIIIFSLFIVLIMLGSFRVPQWSIEALGFFAFIFLFEFIILIADAEIHHLTHGEPYKILGIKIILIAFLLPFHHWIEKRVVNYLIRKRLINLADFSLKRGFVKLWEAVFSH